MILGAETRDARRVGAAISELGFDVGLFEGGEELETFGAPAAALLQSSSLCERRRLGLVPALLVARETFNSTAVVTLGAWKRGP